MRLIRLLATTVVLAGCGAVCPLALSDPPDGYARVIAYRARLDISAVYAHHLWIDGKAAADLIPGSYSEFQLRAGPHRARTGDAWDTHRPEIAFTATAGETLYFRFGSLPMQAPASVELASPDAHAGQLRQVTESHARRELENFRSRPPAAATID